MRSSKSSEKFQLSNTTPLSPRTNDWPQIARAALGPDYDLSVVVCGDHLARRLNRTFRRKSYSPNVLAFPLDNQRGEIYLNIRKTGREAKTFSRTAPVHLRWLFIHGLAHLAGFDHGQTMDTFEQSLFRRFPLRG